MSHEVKSAGDHPSPRPRVITEVDSLLELIAAGPDLSGVVVQDVDLTDPRVSWPDLVVREAVFLRCTFRDGDEAEAIRRGAIVFPDLSERPYDPYRTGLYTAEDLNEQITWNGTTDSRDQIIYDWYRQAGRSLPTIGEAFAQRLHDFSIEDALGDVVGGSLDERLARNIVGVMGGHSAKRNSDAFMNAAMVGHQLAQTHLVVTGGGPGVMEGANLGAYLADHPVEDVTAAVVQLAPAPDVLHPDYHVVAQRVCDKYPVGHENLSIPTWFYGFEPSNLFATSIAKYFANSVREEGLLALCLAGIVYVDGAAGTVQEVFMDAAQNYYQTFDYVSPMVFLGRARWEPADGSASIVEVLRSEASKSKDPRYLNYIYSTDSPAAAAQFIRSHPPLPKL